MDGLSVLIVFYHGKDGKRVFCSTYAMSLDLNNIFIFIFLLLQGCLGLPCCKLCSFCEVKAVVIPIKAAALQ